jgi:hypothetical protein
VSDQQAVSDRRSAIALPETCEDGAGPGIEVDPEKMVKPYVATAA